MYLRCVITTKIICPQKREIGNTGYGIETDAWGEAQAVSDVVGVTNDADICTLL